MRAILFPLMIAAGAVAFSGPAGAQMPGVCGSYAETAAQLAGKYSESRVAAGIQGGGLIELWTSAGGGTWTLVLRFGDDKSCMVGAGEGWQAIESAPVEEDGGT